MMLNNPPNAVSFSRSHRRPWRDSSSASRGLLNSSATQGLLNSSATQGLLNSSATQGLPNSTASQRLLIEVAVATSFAIPIAELHRPTRGRAEVAFARQVALYLAHVVFGMSYSAAGSLFHRDRTTAARACKLVEKRRDAPAVESLLHTLEAICCNFWRGRSATPLVQR